MVMLVRLVQELNALFPMLVTLAGMVMLVRLVQELNALSPILVTGMPSIEDGMTSAPTGLK
jgi:hypothetical protein